MSKFTEAVELYCRNINVSVGCKGEHCEYADGNPDHQCEPFFSSTQCDSCGSVMAGDRFPATGWWHADGQFEEIEMSICIDCAMFHANGEEPEVWHG
jgi:hypothetical protein